MSNSEGLCWRGVLGTGLRACTRSCGGCHFGDGRAPLDIGHLRRRMALPATTLGLFPSSAGASAPHSLPPPPFSPQSLIGCCVGGPRGKRVPLRRWPVCEEAQLWWSLLGFMVGPPGPLLCSTLLGGGLSHRQAASWCDTHLGSGMGPPLGSGMGSPGRGWESGLLACGHIARVVDAGKMRAEKSLGGGFRGAGAAARPSCVWP